MTPDLLTGLRFFGWILLPLALAEGFLTYKKSEYKVPFGRAAFASLLFLGFQYFVLLILLPEAVSDAGWRLIPDFYVDQTLYFVFCLLVLFVLKMAAYRILFHKSSCPPKPRRQLFWLSFALFNLLPLTAAGLTGLKHSWEWSYDVAKTFPYGIQYVTDYENRITRVSQRNFLGAAFPLTSLPFTPQAEKILYHDSYIPFDRQDKVTADGTLVSSSPYGGLLLTAPDGTMLALTYQTLLHRWRPAVFAVLPGTDIILFQTGCRDFMYDGKRKILYDLAFSRGKITSFTPLAGKAK